MELEKNITGKEFEEEILEDEQSPIEQVRFVLNCLISSSETLNYWIDKI